MMQRLSSKLLAVVVLVLAVLLTACSYTPAVTDVTITPGKAEIIVGESTTLQPALVTEADAEGFQPPMFHQLGEPAAAFEYQSSDPAVATVDTAGCVTAVGPGDATITVTARDAKGAVTKTVPVTCKQYMEDLSQMPDRVDVKIGETADLMDALDPYTIWNAISVSKDEDIGTCEGSILKAIAPGDATIHLTVNEQEKDLILRSIQVAETYKLNVISTAGLVGGHEKLEIAETYPATANGGLDLTYTSTDEEVVTVDPDGTIHYAGAGEAAVITENEAGCKVSVDVTVIDGELTNEVSIMEDDSAFVAMLDGTPIVYTDQKTILSVFDGPAEMARQTYNAIATGKLKLTIVPRESVKTNEDGSVGTSGNQYSSLTSAAMALDEAEKAQTTAPKTGSTDPNDYDRSDAAVAAALDMLGQARKCSEVAEAAAQARGKTGWKYQGNMGFLNPETFLDIGTIVPYDQAQPGDILYYADGGLGFSHVAVYIGGGMAVHGNFDANMTTKIASATYTTLTHVIHI